jgi:hypothetical protein
MIFFGCVYISRISIFQINRVEVIGNKVVDTEAITEIAQKEMVGKYLWLFPKINILLYPRNAIKKELSNNFRRLNTINLNIKTKNTLQITVTERTGVYTWCGPARNMTDTTGITKAEKCYFMDENGYIFDEAPYFSGEVYFKFYGLTNIKDSSNPVGSSFGEKDFKQLISFKNVLVNLGMKPTALYSSEDGDIHVLLSGGITGKTGPEIILKADSDFGVMAENLQAALSTEPFQSDFKNKYSSLVYIDLRYGNKVFYKFK